jgi:hypothetical protein
MLIVNIGSQGFTKVLHGEKGAVIETKEFLPNIPVDCSKEMGIGLLKKYNNPTMQIIMRSAEGFALSENPVTPIISKEEKVNPPVIIKKRGRPRKQ